MWPGAGRAPQGPRGGQALITVPFGRALTDDFKRVYDPPRLRELLSPLLTNGIEYAVSRAGLWIPAIEAEAATIDWNGPHRAVALVVATKPMRAEEARE